MPQLKPWQRPRRSTFWRSKGGTQLQVLSVRRGIVTWRFVPTPLEHHTTPARAWRMQRVWIGGETDFPK